MPTESKQTYSPEVIQEAAQLAKKVKAPQQTKEQTKIIEQGIRKGLAQYKKQQKAQARDQDKQRKKQLKQKELEDTHDMPADADTQRHALPTWLPWSLLLVSWVGFVSYVLTI
jgi:hypothetical protein